MDPVTIAGLVGNILQFLSFSHEVLSTAREISASAAGTTTEIWRLKSLVVDIKASTKEMTKAVLLDEHQDRDALAQLAMDCEALADKLLGKLSKLDTKKQGLGKKMDSVKISVLYSWKKAEINALKVDLLAVESRLSKWWDKRTERKREAIFNKTILDLSHSMEQLQAQSPRQTLEGFQDNLNSGVRGLRKNTDRYLQILKQEQHLAVGQREDFARLMKKVASEHVERLDATRQTLESLLDELKLVERQRAVIRSLQFPSIRRRQGDIEIAHKNTLEWIFDRSRTVFTGWLEREVDIFWINGLAGSGKSTLMKFVAGHPETSAALAVWAKGETVVTASHYFWNAGTDMQKSQQGLFQSLLYHILRAAPGLVDTICAHHALDDFWDIDELKAAFKALSTETDLGTKFCFFIDGLDEYGGAEEDIIEVVKYLAGSPHIKVCTASRPWPAFSSEWFSSAYTIRLQDYTREDMAKYVREKLTQNPMFLRLAEKDARCYELAPEITKRASGVWLWVYLAVRDLLRDMRDNEEFDQLMTRLNSYPKELRLYFEDIMRRIDPIHREMSAQIFLLVVAAVRPLSILAFTALGVWKDADSVAKMDLRPAGNREVTELNREWQPKLQNRCRDLLKITFDDSETSIFKYRVDFLHRTVRDFLRDHHQQELLRSAPFGFDAVVCLSRLMVVFLKRMEVANFRANLNALIGLVDELLLYAWLIEQYPKDQYLLAHQGSLLDELDRVMTLHARSEQRHWTNARDSPAESDEEPWFEGGQSSWLALATQAHLRLYLVWKLAVDPSPAIKKPGRPLLDYALRPRRVTPVVLPYNVQYDIPWIDELLVAELLDRGADPNHRIRIYEGQTPWALFLMSCRRNWAAAASSWSQPTRDSARRTMLLLLRRGADPAVRIPPLLGAQEATARTAVFQEPVVLDGLKSTSAQWVPLADVLGALFSGSPEGDELLATAAEKEAAAAAESHTGVLGRIMRWMH